MSGDGARVVALTVDELWLLAQQCAEAGRTGTPPNSVADGTVATWELAVIEAAGRR